MLLGVIKITIAIIVTRANYLSRVVVTFIGGNNPREGFLSHLNIVTLVRLGLLGETGVIRVSRVLNIVTLVMMIRRDWG